MKKFYDLGEEDPITPTKDNLYRIMDAVIRCKARVHDIHADRLNPDKTWMYPARSSSVLFRIELEEDLVTLFNSIAKFPLTPAPKVGVS